MDSSYWANPEHTRLLREVTHYYLMREGYSRGHKRPLGFAELDREVAASVSRRASEATSPEVPSPAGDSAGKRSSSYEVIRDFLYNESQTHSKLAVIEDIFQHVVEWFQTHRDGLARDTLYLRTLDDRRWFERLARSEAVPGAAAQRPDGARFSAAIEDMLRSYLQIDHASSQSAAATLTGRRACAGAQPAPSERQGFETYRYSSIPGKIVKTFTVVTPPSTARPFCTFRNFYRNPESTVHKESDGIVLSLKHAIYCVGAVRSPAGDAIGLKVMIIPHSPSADIFSGLMLTVDDQGSPITARVVLKRTAARHSSDCPPDVIPFEQADAAIDAQIIRRIRNHIDFEVGSRIYSTDEERHVGTSDIVRLVGHYCGAKLQTGGRSFNPAAHEFYPFNQALRCFDHQERYEQIRAAATPS